MWIEINADSLLPVPDIGSGMESYRKFIGISKISAYGEICRYLHNNPSPVIAFLDVVHSKAVGQICDEILICIFCSFYFYDTKLHEVKMSLISVKKLIKMRCVFTRINISVHIRLIFHNLCSFVSGITDCKIHNHDQRLQYISADCPD